MAEYESIHGTRVRYLSSDPTLESSYEGQVWYNSTTGTNKALVQIKAWSSGGNMNEARGQLASAGTQTAALAAGGSDGGSPFNNNESEEYNGTSWTEGNNLTTGRRDIAGTGTQTAGLAFGGQSPATAKTEEYDGTSWSEQNDMPATGFQMAGAGTQTAGLGFGGYKPGSPNGNNVTYEYDGTNWTASGTMNTGRRDLAGFGIQTAAVACGGQDGSILNATEEYNGSSWTAVNNLNTARSILAAAGAEVQQGRRAGPVRRHRFAASGGWQGAGFRDERGHVSPRPRACRPLR